MSSLEACLSTIPPCNPTDAYELGVFATTNEFGQENTLEKLSCKHIAGNTAIGVGGFFILNAVASFGSKTRSTERIQNIVIIDCSECVQVFWQNMKVILAAAQNRTEAKVRILEDFKNSQLEYWLPSKKTPSELSKKYSYKLRREIDIGISFLSTEERFQLIHQIAANGNLECVRINLFDPMPVRQMQENLKATGRTIGLVYVSNVSEFAFKTIHSRNPAKDREGLGGEVDEVKADGFLTSTSLLVGESTVLIHACSSADGNYQKVTRVSLAHFKAMDNEPQFSGPRILNRDVFSWKLTKPV
jgi:hypothetical protein